MHKRTDGQIKHEVLAQLRTDARVNEEDVGVEVDEGIVTLTGVVDSLARRLAAQEAAHRAPHVLDVANNLEVAQWMEDRFSDVSLATVVRQALLWNVFVPDTQIRTTVDAGEVTLEGEVDYQGQKHDAELAVSHLQGVRAVVNKLTVRFPATDAFVRGAIATALQRHALREAYRIEVVVHDGEVTLRGAFDGQGLLRAAVGAATGSPGVTMVRSELEMLP